MSLEGVLVVGACISYPSITSILCSSGHEAMCSMDDGMKLAKALHFKIKATSSVTR
jgi:hypothetical protein